MFLRSSIARVPAQKKYQDGKPFFTVRTQPSQRALRTLTTRASQAPQGGISMPEPWKDGFGVKATVAFRKGDIVCAPNFQKCNMSSWRVFYQARGFPHDNCLDVSKLGSVNGAVVYDITMPNLKQICKVEYDSLGCLPLPWQNQSEDVCDILRRYPPPGIPSWYFFNHESDDPNLYVSKTIFKIKRPPYAHINPQPVFLAKRDIQVGEWLTYSYAVHDVEWCRNNCKGCYVIEKPIPDQRWSNKYAALSCEEEEELFDMLPETDMFLNVTAIENDAGPPTPPSTPCF